MIYCEASEKNRREARQWILTNLECVCFFWEFVSCFQTWQGESFLLAKSQPRREAVGQSVFFIFVVFFCLLALALLLRRNQYTSANRTFEAPPSLSIHHATLLTETVTDPTKMNPEKLTLILVNLAGIMERADESLLPGVYKEVGAALHTDPTGLGSLTLFRSAVQSLCYPVAAYLAACHNRVHVIAMGAFLWAGATFLVAFSSTFTQVCESPLLIALSFLCGYISRGQESCMFPVRFVIIVSPVQSQELLLFET